MSLRYKILIYRTCAGSIATIHHLVRRVAYYGIKFHRFRPFLLPIARFQHPGNKLLWLILHQVNYTIKCNTLSK